MIVAPSSILMKPWRFIAKDLSDPPVRMVRPMKFADYSAFALAVREVEVIFLGDSTVLLAGILQPDLPAVRIIEPDSVEWLELHAGQPGADWS